MICRLCPRDCGAERTRLSGNGFCRMGTDARVARAAPHFGEEPCVSGTRGTGAVFFAGCALACAYCQNYELSHGDIGRTLSCEALADVFARLEEQGVHSLSLVTAGHFLPAVLRALSMRKPRVPVLYNTSGYESAGAIAALAGHVDVYLPDMKHVSSRLSGMLAGAPDYYAVACEALRAMRAQVPQNEYNDEGILTRGVLVRHLVLPGCTGDSMRVLNFLAENLPGTPVSVMRQYTPIPQCTIPGMDRRVTDAEYARVLAHAHALGIPGYLQGADSAQAIFTPAFDLTGVL